MCSTIVWSCMQLLWGVPVSGGVCHTLRTCCQVAWMDFDKNCWSLIWGSVLLLTCVHCFENQPYLRWAGHHCWWSPMPLARYLWVLGLCQYITTNYDHQSLLPQIWWPVNNQAVFESLPKTLQYTQLALQYRTSQKKLRTRWPPDPSHMPWPWCPW